MKALATLRHLLVIALFAMAAATASASEGSKKQRKAAPKSTVAQASKPAPARREVAAFVDPTAPLGDLVKRLSAQR